MSTTASSSEQEMATLACPECDRDRERRVLIGGLGFGFTLKKVLELVSDESEVVVAELLKEIIDWNHEHLREVNGALLDDPRVKVLRKDVFKIMQGGIASMPSCWMSIIVLIRLCRRGMASSTSGGDLKLRGRLCGPGGSWFIGRPIRTLVL